jgi:O-antigen/teichoic acid export membrane protein
MLKRLYGTLEGDSLAARARRGSILTVVGFGSANVLRLASNLVLTRLLYPEAFGLMSLVQVITGALLMFSDIGLRASLVQNERGDDPDFVNTAWTLQVIRGAFLSAAVALLTPFAADFYDEPMLASLLPVAGLSAFIGGFMPTRAITANRHLTLGRLTVVTIGNQIITLLITAALAWMLQSVWGLVYGMLIGGLLRNSMFRIFVPGIPNRFAWDRQAARELIGFGKFVFIGTLATFLISTGDRAILGKFITLDALGIYSIATTLATVPLMLYRTLAWKIIFPLYSRRKPHENAKNRRKLFRARYAMTALVVAGSFVLVVFGDPMVRFLYDPRYHAAGGMTVLLTLGLLPALIVTSYDSVLLANGRSDLHAICTVSNAVLRILALYLGIRSFGVLGAAVAPTVATLLHYPVLVWFIRRYRAWDPLHDAVFLGISLAIAALAFATNADVLMAVPRN